MAQPLGKRWASAGPVLAALLERLASLQLIAWEPEQEEEVTMVTARPNFQDSIHVGFVSGLKKFTEYFTSVLCFTTPGDGPRSTPQLVRTHEDGRQPPAPAPSAPGSLRAPGSLCPRLPACPRHGPGCAPGTGQPCSCLTAWGAPGAPRALLQKVVSRWL